MNQTFQRQSKNQEGYHIAKGLLYEARNATELIRAVEKIVVIIQEYELDHVQEEALEELGYKRYYAIEREGQAIIKNQRLNFHGMRK